MGVCIFFEHAWTSGASRGMGRDARSETIPGHTSRGGASSAASSDAPARACTARPSSRPSRPDHTRHSQPPRCSRHRSVEILFFGLHPPKHRPRDRSTARRSKATPSLHAPPRNDDDDDRRPRGTTTMMRVGMAPLERASEAPPVVVFNTSPGADTRSPAASVLYRLVPIREPPARCGAGHVALDASRSSGRPARSVLGLMEQICAIPARGCRGVYEMTVG